MHVLLDTYKHGNCCSYTTLHTTQCCSVPSIEVPVAKVATSPLEPSWLSDVVGMMLCAVHILTSVIWMCESLSKFDGQCQMGNVFWLGDYRYCLHF